jgi:O-antigen/teichoic acid export membrane protein
MATELELNLLGQRTRWAAWVALIQRAGLYRIATRIGFAVCDQAVFAGSSFAVTLLMVRWMTQNDFGAFSVSYSVYMLVQTAFDGLVAEPLAVFGAGRFADWFDTYLGLLLIGHVVLGMLMLIVLLIAAAVIHLLGGADLSSAFAGMAIAAPFLCARSLTRQPLYVLSRIHWSVVAGAVQLVCTVIGLQTLHSEHLLNPFDAFLTLGVGSGLASAVVLIFCLGPKWRNGNAALGFSALIVTHLAYGRWAVSERFVFWLQTNALYLVLPLAAGGLHASAAYRAGNMLAMPAYMTVMTLGSVILPAMARAHASAGTSQRGQVLTVAVGAAVLCYALLLVGFGHAAGSVLFDGQYDTELDTIFLTLLGMGVVLYAIDVMMEIQLRAQLLVRQVFIARLVATVAQMTVGVALSFLFGLKGAALALVVTWMVTIVTIHIGTRTGRTSVGLLRTGGS